MAGDKELVTAQALAEALDLSVETIWRYTRENKIPYVELGSRQYRYKVDDVIKAMGRSTAREQEASYNAGADRKFTYQDYLELPEEPGYRFEVLEGVLVKDPSPNVAHQRVSRRLQRILEDYFWQVDPEGETFNAPLDVTFHEHTVVQPDLFYVSGKKKQIIQDACINAAPALVVEVLSPSTRRKDRLQKMQIYQKARVSHYWLVSPEEKTLECFQLIENVYALVASGMDADEVRPPGFSGLSISLKDLWGS
jgi:Uma2 family endonuclease